MPDTADTEPAVVIFRKWPPSDGGGIIALFPYMPADVENPMWAGSYMDQGGYGRANYWVVMDGTSPASPGEYAALKAELESEPYSLRLAVRLRTPHDAGDVRTAAWRRLRGQYAAGTGAGEG
jgi:hypothetical protein